MSDDEQANAAAGGNQNQGSFAQFQQFIQNLAGQSTTNREVSRIGIKPPTFCQDQPDLFFIQMESQFAVAGITVDQTKYHHVISSLEAKYLLHVSDIVRNPKVNMLPKKRH